MKDTMGHIEYIDPLRPRPQYCAQCGDLITAEQMGSKPRKYCSTLCGERASNARARARKAATAEVRHCLDCGAIIGNHPTKLRCDTHARIHDRERRKQSYLNHAAEISAEYAARKVVKAGDGVQPMKRSAKTAQSEDARIDAVVSGCMTPQSPTMRPLWKLRIFATHCPEKLTTDEREFVTAHTDQQMRMRVEA